VYGWRRMAENTDAHCRFLAIGLSYLPYALFCGRETNDVSRTTDEGRPFAHPAGDADTNTAHELFTPYCATCELFRSLLDGSAGKLPHRPREPGQLFPE
jgi:hypothetical protein